MCCQFFSDYLKYRKDIRNYIPMPDFSQAFTDEALNPYRDTVLLIFFVTRRCNLNCSFCYLNLDNYKTAFSDKTFDATVDSVHKLMGKPLARRMHGVSLFGGEPLVNEDIEGIVDAFIEYKKTIYMTTNGLLLPKSPAMLSKVDQISVSIYENTIGKLAEILPSLKTKNPMVTTFAITKSALLRNPGVLEEIVDLSRASSCKKTSIYTVTPFQRTEDGSLDESEAIMEGTEEAKLYAEIAARVKSKGGYPVDFYAPRSRQPGQAKKTKCLFAWWYICSDAKGNSSPCACVMPPEEKHGNIFKDGRGMGRTWNSPEIREARRWFLSAEAKGTVPKLCEHCMHLDRSLL